MSSRSARSRAFFFELTGDGRSAFSISAFERQSEAVLEDPLHVLAVVELACLSQSRGEVDIPLLAALALDGLDFGGESHRTPPRKLVI